VLEDSVEYGMAMSIGREESRLPPDHPTRSGSLGIRSTPTGPITPLPEGEASPRGVALDNRFGRSPALGPFREPVLCRSTWSARTAMVPPRTRSELGRAHTSVTATEGDRSWTPTAPHLAGVPSRVS